jgi:K+-sensing histidine kinase KdpD
VAQAIEKSEITIDERISAKLVSPPMFPAELTMVFSNLLTNAVKAARRGGRILLTGNETKDAITVRMENSGEPIKLDTAERWFRPFESRTEIPDARLGQGMGLGLTITRSILDEYGASIQFVKPSKSFATAIELRFRK